MRPFDTRAWNLAKPAGAGALALAACGPGGLDSGEESETDPTTETYGDGWDYTDYSDYSDWNDDDYTDWADDYYNPCNYCAPDEVCDGYMCYVPGCESSLDCGDGLACIQGTCAPIPESLTCGSWPTLALDVPPTDPVLDLSFVDVDDDGVHELVMLSADGVAVLDDDLSLIETPWLTPGSFTRVTGLRIDGDMFIDLAFTSADGVGLRTSISTGDGSFVGETDEMVDILVDPVALDLDLDGVDELVALVDGMPTVVTGVGTGAMTMPLAPSEPYQHIYVGDNDGDGQVDLLLAGILDDPSLSTAAWILQAGGAWSPGPGAQMLLLESPSYWGAYDLDGDGLDNAFAAAADFGAVVMQTWSGAIPAVASVPEGELAWLVGAEFDGTNGEEVLMGTATPRLVQRLNTDPIGCSYPLDGVPAGGQKAVAGDFDGDGIDEVAVLVDGVVELRVSDF